MFLSTFFNLKFPFSISANNSSVPPALSPVDGPDTGKPEGGGGGGRLAGGGGGGPPLPPGGGGGGGAELVFFVSTPFN